MRLWSARLPGLSLSLLIAVAAVLAGHAMPLVGAPITAIVLGILVRNTIGVPASCSGGVAFGVKNLLQAAIVLLGFGIDLPRLWSTGRESVGVMLVTLMVGLIGGLAMGRIMRLRERLSLLIAVGTSICGASAIAAVAPIVGAEAGEIAYAVSAIFLYNVAAVFLFPLFGHALHMSDTTFGIWAGTAVNDTSSVVAAGYSFSRAAGLTATIVKLARTVMIIPVSLAVAAYVAWRTGGQAPQGRGRHSIARHIPWFVLAFVIAAALSSIPFAPHAWAARLAGLGSFFIVVALAAVGLNVDARVMGKAGGRPMALGAIVWALVAFTSLVVQHAL